MKTWWRSRRWRPESFPPVPNFREADPELGDLNLSTGGSYPVQYALRLGAGFGSQLGMSLDASGAVAGRTATQRLTSSASSYRIADATAWAGWLGRVSGYPILPMWKSSTAAPAGQGPGTGHWLPRSYRGHPACGGPSPHPWWPKLPFASIPVQPVTEPVTAAAPATEPEPRVAAESPEPANLRRRRGRTAVIQLVAEKTDYPPDMLDLDLDLEADLGVDTVKQAEVFAESARRL